jgi:hypothetical protein
MAAGTFFVRSCPTCGRSLEVRVELLGRRVECVHCGATFTASEQSHTTLDELRVERALALAQQYIDSMESHLDSVESLDSTSAEGF